MTSLIIICCTIFVCSYLYDIRNELRDIKNFLNNR